MKHNICLFFCKSLDSEMPSGIHVFAVLLHAHLAGRAIRARHFRQQVELQPLASDDQFDFNFQEFQPLSHERIILPVSQSPFRFHNLHCSIWGWNWCCINHQIQWTSQFTLLIYGKKIKMMNSRPGKLMEKWRKWPKGWGTACSICCSGVYLGVSRG